MRKAIKLISILLGTLILLIILGILFLMVFVSPNRLKPMLTEEVMRITGRQLVIDGDLSWTFFPYLGVKVGHSTLSNPSGFKEKTFAEISEITMNVKLIPLFSKQVESDGIVLKGMTLYLIKNKNGEVNWNFKPTNPSPVINVSTTETNQTISGKKAALGLMVKGIDVTNAKIKYVDEEINKQYDITNFELHAKSINLFNPFPIQSSFDFVATNPALSGNAHVKGNALLNMGANIYAFQALQFEANINQNNKKISIDMTGDLIADLNKETFEWQKFQGKVANINMTGNVKVTGLYTKPVTSAHIKLAPFDLRSTLQTIGQDVSNIQIAKPVSGQIDVFANSDGLKMQGNLTVDTLQVSKLTLTNVAIKTHLLKGILDFAPISANLYQGNLEGQAIVNLNNPTPQMTVHAKLNNVQAEPLIDDLRGADQKIKIAGIGNFEMQVTTAGVTSKAILENLNGVSQFHFNNGVIKGLDLGYLVDSGYAIVKREPMNAVNNNQTAFGTLSGTAVIRAGVINNNDLFADTPRFSIRGNGLIDLVNEKIDYTLQTVIKQRKDQKDNMMNLYGITLPVVIKGNLNSPSIRLDSADIAKQVAQQQINKISDQTKEKIRDKIKDKASDLLNGKAGDVLNNLLGK